MHHPKFPHHRDYYRDRERNRIFELWGELMRKYKSEREKLTGGLKY